MIWNIGEWLSVTIYAAHTHQVTTPRLREEEQKSQETNQHESFTRIGTITLESGALDTMIPAKVGKYDKRGPPTRIKRHREAFATQNTYTLRPVGLQTVGYNYWTTTTVPGTVHRAQSTGSTIELNWILFNTTITYIQQVHVNNYTNMITYKHDTQYD